MSEINHSGARLKKARMAAGFKSAKEFCQKYNISSSTYSLHETGGRNIQPKVAEKYAKFLGINIAWLLTGSGAPYDHPSYNSDAPLTHNEFADLMQYKGNQDIKNSLKYKTELLNNINPLLFSCIVMKITRVMDKLNIHLTNDQLCKKAVEIYKDITLSSSEISAQLTMVDLSITTLKRQLKQLPKKNQQTAI